MDAGKIAGEGEEGRLAGGRPGAADLVEGVEGVGGGGLAVGAKVDGAVGDEVGAAETAEVDGGLEDAGANGAPEGGAHAEFAADAGVVADEDAAGFAEGGVLPLGGEVDGDQVEAFGAASVFGAAQGAFERDETGVGGAGIGAGGLAGDADPPLAGLREPEGEVGFGERERQLFEARFDVDAGVGGFDVGESRVGAGGGLGGGSGGDLGGFEEDAFDVPLAVGGVDQIDAGLFQADPGELDLFAVEGGDAEGRLDLVGADDGLGAEGGVFGDDEVCELEAGEGKKDEGDAVEMDRAAEAGADAGDDAALEAVDVQQWRQDG